MDSSRDDGALDAAATGTTARDLFEAVPDPAAIHDPETGAVVDVNDRFCELVGYDRDRLLGAPLSRFADTESEPVGALLERFTSAGEGASETVEWRYEHADGDELLVSVTLAPIGMDDGQYVFASVRDVTVQRERERELVEYRRRLEGAMLAGEVAWWEMDARTGAVAFQDRKAEMLDRDPAAFEHFEDFTDLVHPDDYEGAMDAMRDHLDGRAAKYDTEYRIETADGDYRWFHDVGGVTARDDDGAPVTVTGIVLDITRRKQTEARLRRQNEQLTLLNRIVHHDIRNDVDAILLWLDLIDEDLSPKTAEALERIGSTCQNVLDVTDSLKDLMDVIGDEGTIDLEPVALRSALEDELAAARDRFGDATVTAPDLPEASVQVRATPMLSSVFRNLLNNAVQHHDGDSPTVAVSTTVESGRVVVSVVDDGPGVPPDQREAVFGRGERGLDSSGSGVGLYLVDTLVTLFGGEVWITDAAEADVDGALDGAVFNVALDRWA